MATKYIAPTSVPIDLTLTSTQPLNESQLLSHLTTFLETRQHLSADVLYQLTELHRSVQWQVENGVAGLKVLGPVPAGAGFEAAGAESREGGATEEAGKKKKKGKKGGSKWA